MIDVVAQLKIDEGYRRFLYKDSNGIWTIAYGRNIQNRGITESEAEYLLKNDIDDFAKQLRDRLYWFDSIHEDAQAVLIMMCFNMGLGGLLTFTHTLEHIKNENYKMAADDLLQSKYANQVGERAVRLANILKAI